MQFYNKIHTFKSEFDITQKLIIILKQYFLNKIFFDNPWDTGSAKEKGGASNDSDKIKNGIDKMFEFINNGKKNDKNSTNGGGGYGSIFNMLKLVLVALLVGWLSTGFYTIEQDQEGVVLRLGKYNRTSLPGLNWKFPDPVEMVEKISVTRLNKEFIGLKASSDNFDSRKASLDLKADATIEQAGLPESQILTSDENIIEMHFFVQWRIKDAKNYLFNIRDDGTESTVRSAAQSAMQEVIGLTKLYDALSEQRQVIEAQAKQILQSTLDLYGSGVEITSLGILYSYVAPEVRDAYRDIQSAKADKERYINQAYSYRNDILPKARGEAQSIVEQASGYKSARISEAHGESARFLSLYEQYRKSKSVVRNKMYLETMEKIYAEANKIVTDKNAAATVPILGTQAFSSILSAEKMNAILNNNNYIPSNLQPEGQK